jgi:hypothetical protein
MSRAVAPRVSRRVAVAALLLFTMPPRKNADFLFIGNRTGARVEAFVGHGPGQWYEKIEPNGRALMYLPAPDASLCRSVDHEAVFRDNLRDGLTFVNDEGMKVHLTGAELRARVSIADTHPDRRQESYELILGPDFFRGAAPPGGSGR